MRINKKDKKDMKKSVIVLLAVLICAVSMNTVVAKTTTNSSLASAIRLYKSGNYAQSYEAFSNIVKKDPSNAVAYYYLAMSSAQVGNKNEAIANYQKVITLSPGGQLERYATKGKVCLETPNACNDTASADTELDRFIKSRFGCGFSDEARADYENQKLQNLRREINRSKDISPREFKNYKDFSSEVPTNDEIVTALRTLQRAGFNDIIGNNSYTDLSGLTNNQNSEYAMLNMLLGNGRNSVNMNPQLIQSLLTTQMSSNF